MSATWPTRACSSWHYDGGEPINLGGGSDMSIAETAQLVADVVGYRGRLSSTQSRPDGMPLKGLDSSAACRPGLDAGNRFRTALAETYAWFRTHVVTEEMRNVRAAV